MDHKTYTLKAFDGKELFTRIWETEKKPKAIIDIIHGLGDHGGRYDELAGFLTGHGYTVLAMDYRGHGKSGGIKGHAGSFENILKDIDMMMSHSGMLYPNIPKILYGHSMGGSLAINYYISRFPVLKAIVVSSPWLRLAKDVPCGKLLAAKIIKNVAPRVIFKTGIHANELTGDAELVGLAREDTLRHNHISAKLYFEAINAGQRAMANIFKITIPILCMHGIKDTITSHEACEEFVMNTSDKTHFKSWNVSSHELHHDANRHEIFNYLVNWLNRVCQ